MSEITTIQHESYEMPDGTLLKAGDIIRRQGQSRAWYRVISIAERDGAFWIETAGRRYTGKHQSAIAMHAIPVEEFLRVLDAKEMKAWRAKEGIREEG